MMYVVQVFEGSNYYTDDRDVAEDVFAMIRKEGRYAELLEGEPGHFAQVK